MVGPSGNSRGPGVSDAPSFSANLEECFKNATGEGAGQSARSRGWEIDGPNRRLRDLRLVLSRVSPLVGARIAVPNTIGSIIELQPWIRLARVHHEHESWRTGRIPFDASWRGAGTRARIDWDFDVDPSRTYRVGRYGSGAADLDLRRVADDSR